MHRGRFSARAAPGPPKSLATAQHEQELLERENEQSWGHGVGERRGGGPDRRAARARRAAVRAVVGDRLLTSSGAAARAFPGAYALISEPDEMMPEMMLRKQIVEIEVEELLKTLSDREAQVLRLHFGQNGETPESFEEIGRLLKLSRERVRQINGIALSKLKQTSILGRLEMYIV